jgi:hypothetical protein
MVPAHHSPVPVRLYLKYMWTCDVQDLLQSHDKALDDEDLINLGRECDYDAPSDYNDKKIDVALKGFTLTAMDEMFRISEIFKEKILNGDSNLKRSMKVCHEIENSIPCYRVLYEKKKRKKERKKKKRKKNFHQTTLHQFLYKKE